MSDMADSNEMRTIIREELTALVGELLAGELNAIAGALAAMRPRLDGLPLLANAIEVLQKEVRALRDEVRVASSMVLRIDNSRDDVLAELRAIERAFFNASERIRRLENADE